MGVQVPLFAFAVTQLVINITSQMTTRDLVMIGLRPWRVLVVLAHIASVLLALSTAALGLAIGPTIAMLVQPGDSTLTWREIFGPTLTQLFAHKLPEGGLASSTLFDFLPYVVMCIATIKALCLFFQWGTWELLGERLALGWRRDVALAFSSVDSQRRDDGFIEESEQKIGSIVAQEIRSLREFVVHYYGGLPREGLQVVLTSVILVFLSPHLFFVFLLCIAPVGIVLSRFGRRMRRRASQALSDQSIVVEWIQQRLIGLETIKHYKTELYELDAFRLASNQLFKRFYAAARLKARTSPVIEVFGVLAMAVALWIAYAQIGSGNVSGSVVLSFFSTLAFLTQSASKLGRYINANQEGKAAGSRLIELVTTMQEHKVWHDSKNKAAVMHDGSYTKLEVSGLTVTYAGAATPALQDVTVDFAAGKVYCIAGKSGAGKSTFMAIMLGLREPTKGEVRYQVSPVWRERSMDIIYMPQSVVVVPASIAQNISYPKQDYDIKRCEAALLQANFDLLNQTSRLPEGILTEVGPGQVQLSGGQLQRLQLARLIYHNAPFVLVDEGTSALDPKTEAEVLQRIRHLAKMGAVVIVIAHRLAAAEASDEVLLFDHGRLIRRGPPAEVLGSVEGRQVFGG